MRAKPYGYFPSRRRRSQPGPEPIPDGPYKRYYGAAVAVPATADEVLLLGNSDYRATVSLTIGDSGTDRDKPFFCYACPTAYGTVASMTSGGLSLDFDTGIVDVEGVEYRIYSPCFEQWDTIALSFS